MAGSGSVAAAAPVDTEAQKKALEILRKLEAEWAAADSTQLVMPARKLSEAQVAEATRLLREAIAKQLEGSKPSMAGAPSAAPATPKTKVEKLEDLLELYKADKITSADYQDQRAKLLAEP